MAQRTPQKTPLQSKKFPFGNSGLVSPRSQIPSQPQQTRIWCKIHLEIHGRNEVWEVSFPLWAKQQRFGGEKQQQKLQEDFIYSQKIIYGYGITTGFSNKVHARKTPGIIFIPVLTKMEEYKPCKQHPRRGLVSFPPKIGLDSKKKREKFPLDPRIWSFTVEKYCTGSVGFERNTKIF